LAEHDFALDLRGQVVELTTMFQRSICAWLIAWVP
jgi:hypothetical protein